MKIGIVIIVYNLDTRIFILQIESIKRFCKDTDYTIIIYDNSTDEELSNAIRHHAGVLGVDYRNTISNSKDPSVSHSFAANFAYEKLKGEFEMLVFLDHDIICVRPFSFEEILGNHIAAGVMQGTKIKYLWPGFLILLDKEINKELIDFSPNNSLHLDTGGELRNLVDAYDKDRILFLEEAGAKNPYFSDKKYYFYIMIHNKTFCHFLNSSNWAKTKNNEERINTLINIATNYINENDLLLDKQ